MAEAIFIPGHVQCQGAWSRHRRHDDRCGTWTFDRSSSQVVPNLGMEKCSVRLRESELVFQVRRACLSSPCTARHSNRSGSTTQKGKIRTKPILFAFRPCIYCVLLHLSVRTPTVAGKFTLPTTSGTCQAFAGWFSNQAVTPAAVMSAPWMKPRR